MLQIWQALIANPPLIIAFITTITLFINTIVFFNTLRLNRQTYRQQSLKYVTDQFDRLTNLHAREEMNKTGNNNIEDYLNKLPNSTPQEVEKRKKAEQLLLEYVYTFNRIGLGIYNGSLDKETIFNVWSPNFFQKHREKYDTFIKRKRIGNEDAYSFFDWLAKEECPKYIDKKYPQEKPRP